MSEGWRTLLGTSRACACGHTHTVPTREVIIAPGAIEALGEVIAVHTCGPRGAIVADDTTWQVAGGQALKAMGPSALAPVVLSAPDGRQQLKADEHALAQLQGKLPDGVDFLVAVGSGVINDLTKLLASSLGVPSICVGTAPSMNGYPSAISAIFRGGLKLTEPCTPPIAIVCDTDVLAAAPVEMVQAGLGDLLSKSTSSTDWLMAHLVTGEQFCEVPVRLVERAEAMCREQAVQIGRREPAAIETLTCALIQSGISMAMAGSSSPASGGEHLISHYWDMTAVANGRRENLHGRQVAVATLITSALYEALIERTTKGVDLAEAVSAREPVERLRARSLDHFVPLLGNEAGQGIANQLAQKTMTRDRAQEALRRLPEAPGEFWAQAGRYLRPARELKQLYRDAGVPTRASDLGIPYQQVRDAVSYARHIRSRYTVLDLAADLGLLEQTAEEVIARAGV